jgi:hypothetical protein
MTTLLWVPGGAPAQQPQPGEMTLPWECRVEREAVSWQAWVEQATAEVGRLVF